MIIYTFTHPHPSLSKQCLDIFQSALSFFEREAKEKDIKKKEEKKSNQLKAPENYLHTKEVLTVMDFPPQSLTSTPLKIIRGTSQTEKAKPSVTSKEAFWNTIRSSSDIMK